MDRPSEHRELAQALFRPRSVALIGISDDPGKTAGRPLRFLRKHGFGGAIFPINPNRGTVQGERAYRSLAEVPGPVDHAYILVNTPAVEEAVAACAAKGVIVATILASGFAEAGAAGMALQARIVEIARKSGLRLVGPNSLGVVDTHAPMALTANAAFAAEAMPKGRLSVISQSGAQLGTFISRGATRGIGFAKLISVGNEADLTVGEIGAALVADPDTDAFLLFLETIRGPDAVAAFARAAATAGKPVLAYKLGRSAAGQELAVSHTGALVGSDAAVDAFFRAHGIIRVDHLETLLEMPPLAIGRAPAPARTRKVGVVTTTGGGAAMVVDRLGALGVEVAGPSAALLARLKAANVAVQPGPIVDLTLAGTRYEAMRAALEALLAAPEYAVVAAVVGSSAQFNPELAVKPIVDCAQGAKPIAVFIVPEAAATLRLLAEKGVAAFRTPEACADAIAAYLAWKPPRPPLAPADAALLATAQKALAAGAESVLDEGQSLALFAALGIAAARFSIIDPAKWNGQPLPFDFPVAAKVLSSDITHKTEAGGVALGIASTAELRERSTALVAAVRAAQPAARIAGVLVQKMECGIAEVLVGYCDDAQAGPVISVGLGGTFAEIYRDMTVRLAPVSIDDAVEMIAETRGLAVLRGFRGAAPGDLAALAEAVSRLSRLAELPGRPLLEAEINPLIVRRAGQGVVAVDGVARRKAAPAQS